MKMKPVKKNFIYLIIVFLVLAFFANSVLALTANSSNYSINSFGNGIATGTPSSTNYNVTFLSEAKGTTRNAGNILYTGNIGFFNDTPYNRTVSIVSYSISPTSAVVGSTIGLSISALNYDSLWAEITSPNSQQQTLNLINGQTVNYVPSPSVVGTYNVTFYANSSIGAIASAIDSFEFTAATTTTPSSGGGGGGSKTTIIEKCSYNWDCTPWSVCSDGKQTRECKNIGTCNESESKPIEEILCSEALFDISLILKNIELTENKTLKFGINITEKGGVEKIDGHIKYSIIDKEGYEIFGQIETKAIQGNLFYEKVIKEVELSDGAYILRVDILYGNLQRAFSEQNFIIEDGKLRIQIIEKEIINKSLIIFWGLILLTILIIFILIRLKKKKGEEIRKENLNRIWGRANYKSFLITLFSIFVIGFLFFTRKDITGFAIINQEIKNNTGVLGLILILSIMGLALLYRNKIKKFIEKVKLKNHKNSIKGLMKKKVYTEEGTYIGYVKEVILHKNRIDSLKINLGNKIKKVNKIKKKGISIRYKNVKNVGHIVIIKDSVFEHLNKTRY